MEIIENKRIKEKVYHKKLDSGLSIYFMPKKGYVQKHAVFATNYGSNNNCFIPIGEEEPIKMPAGMAHFLEHKLFEHPEEDIFNRFSKLGADANAYTSFGETAYVFSAVDRFYESLAILVEFVQNPYFTVKNIEEEKKIIEQEIRMYEDDADWRVYSNCLNGMYTNHPVKIDIAGSVDSIQDIDKEGLYRCYNTFYNPWNMALFIVGDLSFEKIVETVEGIERSDFSKDIKEITTIYPDEPERIKKQYIEERLSTSMPLFSIGIKDTNLNKGGRDLVKQDLSTNILLEILFGESSQFYNDLYARGLVDNSFESYYAGKKDYGHSLIIGQSNEPSKVYEEVLKHIKIAKKGKISNGVFQRIKNKNIGGFLMGLNSLDFISDCFVDNHFGNFLFLDILDVLDGINIEDIENRLIEDIDEEEMVLSIINPIS